MASVEDLEAVVVDALLERVGQLNLDPSLEVSYPNVPFTPVLNVPYLETQVLFNTTEAEGFSFESDRTLRGLLTFIVFWPPSQGVVKPVKVAGQVARSFKPGTVVLKDEVEVKVYEEPSVRPYRQEPDWTSVPVVVRWSASSGAV